MIVYRASEYGRCIRASVADLLGKKRIPVSDRMLDLYRRGNVHEDACVAAMIADGWSVKHEYKLFPVDNGQVYVGIHCDPPTTMVCGHLDGICRSPDLDGIDRVLEIKSPYTFASFEHAVKTATWTDPYMIQISWQISCYMAATGLECVMACVDDLGLRTFGIERPLHSADEIIERIVEIERWVQIGEQSGGEVPDDIPCPAAYVCAWPYLHDERTITPIDDPAIIDDAREYLKWGAQEKLAKAAKEKLRDQLLARLQVGTYQTGDAVTTVYEQGSSRWDETALVDKYGPEVLDHKVAGEKTPRLKVT